MFDLTTFHGLKTRLLAQWHKWIYKFVVIVCSSDFQPVFRGKLVFRERSSGVPQEI